MASSALEYQNAIMNSHATGVKRRRENSRVKDMGMVDVIRRNGWRPARQQRFNFLLPYRRLVVEAVTEGICLEHFRAWVVT